MTCSLRCWFKVTEATRQATIYTHVGIETAFPIGNGHGPLNHMHSLLPRVIPPCVPPLL